MPFEPVSRRRFLAYSAAAFAAACVPPAVLAMMSSAKDYVLLHAKAGRISLLGEGLPQSDIWGYAGQVPGPVIRVKQGEKVHARLHNDLKQATTVHWHGIRIDNKMDGVAGLTQQAVASGEQFDYDFTVPDAGTYWYHPHNRSWDQMARGLYGLLIVDEPQPPAVDRDLNFIIDDWRIQSDGNIHLKSLGAVRDRAHDGRIGNVLTVNGLPGKNISVQFGERLRVRLANTANSRILQLRIQGAATQLIAYDGQPLETARSLDNDYLMLPPAGRADLIIDITGKPGSQAVIAETANTRIPLIQLQTHARQVRRNTPLTKRVTLPSNELPEPDLKNAQVFDLDISGGAMGNLRSAMFKGKQIPINELVDKHQMMWAFNGTAGMPDKPFFSVQKGQTVIIRMLNHSSFSHAMHLHGHHMRAIKHTRETRTGKRELRVQKDWRDSMLLQRGEDLSVAFVADNPGKWMLHCHMLEHQAGGMMTWFEVVA